MAKIHPQGWQALQGSGAFEREIETLHTLARQLPDDYTVYHAVQLSREAGGHFALGEIDFVIVNPAGDILLIEQKSGLLDETPDGLVKRYRNGEKRVASQIARSRHELQQKLARLPNGQAIRVMALLYCPDYHIHTPLTAGLDPAQIIDKPRAGQLGTIIQQWLPATETTLAAPQVHRLLREELALVPDVSTLIGQADEAVTRLSGGLTQWARCLDFTPFRLHVSGTAGSGKTQLALAEYKAALDKRLRPLYVCFNRPMADHFRSLVPAGGLACTFHALCDQHLQAHGESTDFAQPQVFEHLPARALARPPLPHFLFDVVIIDEGQDFSGEWRDVVLRHARPDARLIWLQDPMQNLYSREPVDLSGWVRLTANGNYRSPRPIVRFLQRLMPPDHPIEACSPVAASEVTVLVYDSADTLLQRMNEALRGLYSQGFRKTDIAIITAMGRDKSALFGLDRIGQTSLCRFTGQYDIFSQPCFSDGDVLIDSVFRFKGQSAPAVILTELDFDNLDERSLRRLFVGATRARLHLTLVLSTAAAAALGSRLDD